MPTPFIMIRRRSVMDQISQIRTMIQPVLEQNAMFSI